MWFIVLVYVQVDHELCGGYLTTIGWFDAFLCYFFLYCMSFSSEASLWRWQLMYMCKCNNFIKISYLDLINCWEKLFFLNIKTHQITQWWSSSHHIAHDQFAHTLILKFGSPSIIYISHAWFPMLWWLPMLISSFCKPSQFA